MRENRTSGLTRGGASAPPTLPCPTRPSPFRTRPLILPHQRSAGSTPRGTTLCPSTCRNRARAWGRRAIELSSVGRAKNFQRPLQRYRPTRPLRQCPDQHPDHPPAPPRLACPLPRPHGAPPPPHCRQRRHHRSSGHRMPLPGPGPLRPPTNLCLPLANLKPGSATPTGE